MVKTKMGGQAQEMPKQEVKDYMLLMYEQGEQFGLENRMVQCAEECSELIQVICKCQRVFSGDKTCSYDIKELKQNITEEIADVEICLKQLKHILCNAEEVERIKVQKIKRTERLLNK